MLPRREPVSDDVLVRYLLGDLPEDQAERLDEQSVTDDEFAARLSVVEDDLVDLYASGRLTGDRRRRFESFYMSSPRRREKAAFATRLLETLERENNPQKPDAAAQHDRRNIPWFPWAVAAAVALCVAAGWLFVQDSRLRSELTDAQGRLVAADRQASALSTQLAEERRVNAAAREPRAETPAAQVLTAVALVLLPQTRGVGPLPIVAVGPGSRTVPIDLAIEGADPGPFEAALKDPATNQIVWRSGQLPAVPSRPPAVAPIAVPAALLKSQHYAIDLFARRAGQDSAFVGSYAFEVVRR